MIGLIFDRIGHMLSIVDYALIGTCPEILELIRREPTQRSTMVT